MIVIFACCTYKFVALRERQGITKSVRKKYVTCTKLLVDDAGLDESWTVGPEQAY
jgi:hypothetical protein